MERLKSFPDIFILDKRVILYGNTGFLPLLLKILCKRKSCVSFPRLLPSSIWYKTLRTQIHSLLKKHSARYSRHINSMSDMKSSDN